MFALLLDCRTAVRDLEPGADAAATPNVEAERLLYFALVSANEAGLVRTAEDVVTVLSQASAAARANGGAVAKATGTFTVSMVDVMVYDRIL